MKKGLLIWNVVVTIVALVLVLTACTSDSQLTDLKNKVLQQEVAIANLKSEIDGLKSADAQLTAYIQQQENRISGLDGTLLQIVAWVNAQ